MKNGYDPSSPASLLAFASKLVGKTLREVGVADASLENAADKGKMGTLVERYYFNWRPPSNAAHAPDFPDARVELKTTPVVVKTYRGNKKMLRAKERLVLSMIGYHDISRETWETCSLMQKCSMMLLIFYLYEKDVSLFDRRFVYEPLLWTFPAEDLEIIRRDWELIAAKIRDGKAHELSEGDTLYLGACTKAADSSVRTSQPFSEIPAKPRAFSLKPKYMNTILDGATLAAETESVLSPGDQPANLEHIVIERLAQFAGLSDADIAEALGMSFTADGPPPKHYLALLAKRMLGITKERVLEFEKADITVKTVRLNTAGAPKESMSFKRFSYMNIVNETWDEASFRQEVEKRFLFIVFAYDIDGMLRFRGAKFWTMPYADRLEAQRVWALTHERIMTGQAENLPRASESTVAHVRPKAKDSCDTEITPQGVPMVKKCFWLNSRYIQSILADL